MKKEPKFIIRNLGTGHYYCEGKYNFCTNSKFAKQFSKPEADLKSTELKEYFNLTICPAEGKEESDGNSINI